MRLAPLAVTASILATAALADQATIAAPSAAFAKYDPQLSAKEAVLANWELAASGLLAGAVVSDQVVAYADKDMAFAALARQAQFAQKTMLQRHAAAFWIYSASDDLTRVSDGALRGAVSTAHASCAADVCAAERQAVKAAFGAAATGLNDAADDARDAIALREDLPDHILMTEQLSLIAEYLESNAWAADLATSELGRNYDEIAARLVGIMALWNNIEPYVGLTSAEVDAAINTSGRDLLKTLRLELRGVEMLTPGSAEMDTLTAAAHALAAEFRRAAALFAA